MAAKPKDSKDDLHALTSAAVVAATKSVNEALLGDEKPKRGRGPADPLLGELRKQLVPMLVLHFIAKSPSYGNKLIDQMAGLTEGVLVVNPNTMYPLLRDFEKTGLIEGQWENPERRSRRFYTAGTRMVILGIARFSPLAAKNRAIFAASGQKSGDFCR